MCSIPNAKKLCKIFEKAFNHAIKESEKSEILYLYHGTTTDSKYIISKKIFKSFRIP